MNVLVVGAGGFIGSRLCTYLERRGHSVTRASSADGTGLDAASGRLGTGFRVPDGTEAVVYLAQSPLRKLPPRPVDRYLAANSLSAVEVCAWASEAGARRFVFASTGSVYRPSREPLMETAPVRRDDWYALSKLHGEELVALYANRMSVLSCRLFGVYGPGQTERLVPGIIERVKRGQTVDLQPADYERSETSGLRVSVIYVNDLVRILEQLLPSDLDGVVNIASHEVLSVRAIATEVARHLGIQARFRVLDASRSGDLVADIGRLREAVAPVFTPFAEGLRATLMAAGGYARECP